MSSQKVQDEPENKKTKLPVSEQIHLGGLVLVEVFPPSYASSLGRGIYGLPIARQKKMELISWLSKRRTASGVMGHTKLATIQRGCPKGVDSVHIHLYSLQPSLTVLIAIFAIADDAGDLSKVLRTDYPSNGRVSVTGRLGWARSRMPWSRPARDLVSRPAWQPSSRKRQAFEDLIRSREMVCWAWLVNRFPGRFGDANPKFRPSFRIVTTRESSPFVDNHAWLGPPDLRFRPYLWRPTTSENWILQVSDWPRDQQVRATAATRQLMAQSGTQQRTDLHSPQQMALEFGSGHSSVIARWATSCLISLYTDELAALRDHAGRLPRRRWWHRWPRLQLRAALKLDRYLIGDGLDASTVASDVASFAEDPQNFDTSIRAYPEYLDPFPSSAQAANPARELMAWIREGLRENAERLKRDTAAATENIRASAELRQSIANTRMQRVVVIVALLTLIATVVTLILTVRS
jgi:hypothetical protein